MGGSPLIAPIRFFLGNAPEDAHYCDLLEKHLSALRRNGELLLFAASHITPGSETRRVILERLQEADLIVLLISIDFIASDYWYELNLPRALARHAAGDALLIPVMVRPVDWETTRFRHLQPLTISGAPVCTHQDTDSAWHQVALSLRSAMEQQRRRRRSLPAVARPLLSASQPSPAQPPGGGYIGDDYVPRPQQERDALLHLWTPGTPAVLLAPELMGKTLLLQRLVSRLQQGDSDAWTATELAGSSERPGAIVLDLRQFEPEVWSSSEGFFCELAARCYEQLVGEAPEGKLVISPHQPATQRLSHFFESEILSRIPAQSRLVLAIDHADTVCDRVSAESKLPDAFFGLLRVWMERSRTSPLWPRLRLLLAIATSPAYLTRNINQSPFNICLPVEVGDLNDEQIQQLLQRYGLPPDPALVAALRERVGGHPYLIRLALYRAVLSHTPLVELLHEDTVFDDYLLHLRRHLTRIGLFQRLIALQAEPNALLSLEDFQLLQRLGIVVRQRGPNGFQVRLRYPLYQRLFQL